MTDEQERENEQVHLTTLKLCLNCLGQNNKQIADQIAPLKPAWSGSTLIAQVGLSKYLH